MATLGELLHQWWCKLNLKGVVVCLYMSVRFLCVLHDTKGRKNVSKTKNRFKKRLWERNMVVRNANASRWFHLFSRGPRQYKCGKNRQGLFGVRWPALDRSPHGQAEHRHWLRQWEGLVVLFGVPTHQTWTQIHTTQSNTRRHNSITCFVYRQE